MGVEIGSSLHDVYWSPDHFVNRKWFITDKDGVEHQIRSSEELKKIVAQMTPEEFEIWKAQYRFAPIQNLTGNQDYTGTGRDL
jgi:hypothetical protein